MRPGKAAAPSPLRAPPPGRLVQLAEIRPLTAPGSGDLRSYLSVGRYEAVTVTGGEAPAPFAVSAAVRATST